MNAFDSWLKSMAESSKTCDTVITESTKKIKRQEAEIDEPVLPTT